jgi:hypothetical protein
MSIFGRVTVNSEREIKGKRAGKEGKRMEKEEERRTKKEGYGQDCCFVVVLVRVKHERGCECPST